jgi:Mor family transcriptional regulator
MKPCPEPEENGLFNENPLDRAVELIIRLKEDGKDMEAMLKVQQAALADVQANLQEVQDAFFQMGQDDLFQENNGEFINSDDDIFAELVEIVGKEVASRLVDFYSGSSIYIPKNIIIEQKHRKIREEFRNGSVYRELAVRYGYSDQHIRNIIHKKERKNKEERNEV